MNQSVSKFVAWNGYGWQMPKKGRAKIKKGVTPYGGTIQDFIRRQGDTIILFIHPTDREYSASDIEWIKEN